MTRPSRPLIALGALAALAFPAAASAQSAPEFSYGYQANVIFYGGDTDFSGEGYVAAEANGFFAGLWLGSLPGDVEYELSFGYGRSFGAVETTFTYTAYFIGSTGYDTQDVELALGYAISDAFGVGAAVAYDIDNDTWDVSVAGAYAIDDNWEVAATLGHDGTGTYWDAGVTYGFGNGVFVAALYEDSDYDTETITLSVGYEF